MLVGVNVFHSHVRHQIDSINIKYKLTRCVLDTWRMCGEASRPMVKGKELEGKEEKGKVAAWSTKEMSEKVINLLVEDTEEIVSWRTASQEEHAGRINRGGRDEAAENESYQGHDENQSKREEWMRTTVGWSVRYWLLIAKKAWLHAGWEDVMQNWYDWLCEKKDEARKMEEEQKKVSQMIESADGKCTASAQNREGLHILKKEQEDAKPMARCEEQKKEWAKAKAMRHGSEKSGEEAMENEQLKKLEEDLPRLQEGDLAKAAKINKAAMFLILKFRRPPLCGLYWLYTLFQSSFIVALLALVNCVSCSSFRHNRHKVEDLEALFSGISCRTCPRPTGGSLTALGKKRARQFLLEKSASSPCCFLRLR